jgi:ethanolamine ammonia-lyase large subunit/ethanolamine ammonia-lyase small subunit
MTYRHTVGGRAYQFADLKTLLARATPLRSGDLLAGLAAESAQERVAAQMALADTPLTDFLSTAIIPYETDEVTRLIVDTHDAAAFAPIVHFTVGAFRDWLLSDAADTDCLQRLAPGITPEMAAAVTKIMRLQDLILVASKCRVVTRFRNTIGLAGRLSTRIQPNHPTDEPHGVAASLLDGLLLGGGDAVIGINPATDNVDTCIRLLDMLDDLRRRFDMPVQSCILTHVTNTMQAIERGAPVDLVFQSVAGTEAANKGFGIDLAMLGEAQAMAQALSRGTIGNNVMYFETGQGSAQSANAHHAVDQQTLEARAYAVARAFSPLLVNTVVGFIGPEYLYNGKQIIRAGLEDHCCGKLLGLPMGCDVCYTNHAEADQDDMDNLLTLIAAAGCTFIMGVPGADDVMLNYQSTSFHDALYVRRVLGKRPAPEFEEWLEQHGIMDGYGNRRPLLNEAAPHSTVADALKAMVPAGAALAPAALWDRVRQFTPARVGIEPAGVSQPTATHLAFQWDHAQARDAVASALDADGVASGLRELGLDVVMLHTDAADRGEYIQRPDRGRRLDEASQRILASMERDWDVVFVVADGLSAMAANRHAVALLEATLRELRRGNWRIAPVVLVEQGRVAVGDDVAAGLSAQLVVVMIGERPGLTSPDSLGVYLTWKARPGVADSERNCISNVRPQGLPYATASARLLYLMRESRRRCLSGVSLKEAADAAELDLEPEKQLASH